MIDLLIGFVLGVASVGLTTYRMVKVVDSNPLRVFVASIGISIAYFFSIRFIVDQNMIGYIGFSLGAATITTLLASYRKKL
jgi:hypothetical protein